jgi:hypothetical protein
MLDIEELDRSLKLRNLGRLLVTEHPMLKLIEQRINLSEFFFPKMNVPIDKFTEQGLDLLGSDRRNAIFSKNFANNARVMSFFRTSRLRNWIKPASRNSLTIFDLRLRGIIRVENLGVQDLDRLTPILEENRLTEVMRRVLTQIRTINNNQEDL